MSLLQCIDICKSYNDVQILNNISLHLQEGEIVSLLGVSGVGKSTLMNILAGVESPDFGQVLLECEDITGKAGRVGYMLQKDLLFPFKTTLDNICIPLRLQGMKKADARKKAQSQMKLFGLDGSENKYPYQLSGGMKQRAALARTYFLGNKVILLDEPFVALDAITKAEMHKWYINIAKQTELSTIIITHDVDEALTLSDRIYVMSGNPAKITKEIKICSAGKENFALTEQFLNYKREVLTYLI